jgi:hypothetical protein
MSRKTKQKKKSVIIRRFLGQVNVSTKDESGEPIPKEQLKFENKHLKAYLKGHETFMFNKHMFPVKQELTII